MLQISLKVNDLDVIYTNQIYHLKHSGHCAYHMV
jgi:hypothetical protein